MNNKFKEEMESVLTKFKKNGSKLVLLKTKVDGEAPCNNMNIIDRERDYKAEIITW